MRQTIARLFRIASLLALFGVVFAICSAVFSPACARITKHFDAIVVLGGGIAPDGALGPDTSGRVDAGAALFHAGIAPHLHMTGGVDLSLLRPTTASVMKHRAAAQDVPADLITTEGASQSTLENALLSRPMLGDHDSLLLVSDGFHLWRSTLSFWWAGLPARGVCKASDFRPDGVVASARITVRESLALWFNLARATLWTLGGWTGTQDALPEGFLN